LSQINTLTFSEPFRDGDSIITIKLPYGTVQIRDPGQASIRTPESKLKLLLNSRSKGVAQGAATSPITSLVVMNE
jgi:hypothetical protein